MLDFLSVVTDKAHERTGRDVRVSVALGFKLDTEVKPGIRLRIQVIEVARVGMAVPLNHGVLTCAVGAVIATVYLNNVVRAYEVVAILAVIEVVSAVIADVFVALPVDAILCNVVVVPTFTAFVALRGVVLSAVRTVGIGPTSAGGVHVGSFVRCVQLTAMIADRCVVFYAVGAPFFG